MDAEHRTSPEHHKGESPAGQAPALGSIYAWLRPEQSAPVAAPPRPAPAVPRPAPATNAGLLPLFGRAIPQSPPPAAEPPQTAPSERQAADALPSFGAAGRPAPAIEAPSAQASATSSAAEIAPDLLPSFAQPVPAPVMERPAMPPLDSAPVRRWTPQAPSFLADAPLETPALSSIAPAEIVESEAGPDLWRREAPRWGAQKARPIAPARPVAEPVVETVAPTSFVAPEPIAPEPATPAWQESVADISEPEIAAPVHTPWPIDAEPQGQPESPAGLAVPADAAEFHPAPFDPAASQLVPEPPAPEPQAVSVYDPVPDTAPETAPHTAFEPDAIPTEPQTAGWLDDSAPVLPWSTGYDDPADEPGADWLTPEQEAETAGGAAAAVPMATETAIDWSAEFNAGAPYIPTGYAEPAETLEHPEEIAAPEPVAAEPDYATDPYGVGDIAAAEDTPATIEGEATDVSDWGPDESLQHEDVGDWRYRSAPGAGIETAEAVDADRVGPDQAWPADDRWNPAEPAAFAPIVHDEVDFYDNWTPASREPVPDAELEPELDEIAFIGEPETLDATPDVAEPSAPATWDGTRDDGADQTIEEASGDPTNLAHDPSGPHQEPYAGPPDWDVPWTPATEAEPDYVADEAAPELADKPPVPFQPRPYEPDLYSDARYAPISDDDAPVPAATPNEDEAEWSPAASFPPHTPAPDIAADHSASDEFQAPESASRLTGRTVESRFDLDRTEPVETLQFDPAPPTEFGIDAEAAPPVGPETREEPVFARALNTPSPSAAPSAEFDALLNQSQPRPSAFQHRPAARQVVWPPQPSWTQKLRKAGIVSLGLIVVVVGIAGTWLVSGSNPARSDIMGRIDAPTITLYSTEDGTVSEITAARGDKLVPGHDHILTIRGVHPDGTVRNDLAARLQAAQDRQSRLAQQVGQLERLASDIRDRRQDTYYQDQLSEIRQRVDGLHTQQSDTVTEINQLRRAMTDEEARLAGTEPQQVSADRPAILTALLANVGMDVKRGTPVAQIQDCSHLFVVPQKSGLANGAVVLVRLDPGRGAVPSTVRQDLSPAKPGEPAQTRQVVDINPAAATDNFGTSCPIGRLVTITQQAAGKAAAPLSDLPAPGMGGLGVGH